MRDPPPPHPPAKSYKTIGSSLKNFSYPDKFDYVISIDVYIYE
jgi:hypothetical protein